MLMAASPLGASLLTSSITCRGRGGALQPRAPAPPSNRVPDTPQMGEDLGTDRVIPSRFGSTPAGLHPRFSPCPPLPPAHAELC